jgi:hypothetical protein
MPQLLGQPVHHQIDGGVEIMAVILGVKIGPAQREMHLDHEGMLHRPGVVVPERHVRPDEFQAEMFQALDLLRHIGMDGAAQLDMTRADMNLHKEKLRPGYRNVHAGTLFFLLLLALLAREHWRAETEVEGGLGANCNRPISGSASI